ncbi:hypothetical protein BD779DRAFT_784727 [Infundibulicybe gibba]|nr:hypothetical protein BD779DRAFT_784727 [Infundibulicybe gibba]
MAGGPAYCLASPPLIDLPREHQYGLMVSTNNICRSHDRASLSARPSIPREQRLTRVCVLVPSWDPISLCFTSVQPGVPASRSRQRAILPHAMRRWCAPPRPRKARRLHHHPVSMAAE